MQPPEWSKVARLLVMRLDNIGDVILTGPCLRALRRHLPNCRITLMTSPVGADAVPLLPWVDDSFSATVVWQDAFSEMPQAPERESALAVELRARNFDAALILTSFSQSPYPPAYLCYLAGIPLRAGQSREFGGSLLSHWIKPPADSVHQSSRNLHLLRALGIPVSDESLEISVPAYAARTAEQRLRRGHLYPFNFIAIVPGASCQARRYEQERFVEVLRRVPAVTGFPVVVLGGPKEQALRRTLESLGPSRGILSLVGETTLAEAAAIIGRSVLVMANDSAAMHLADALGVPALILYSGTDLESQWEPRKSPGLLLRKPTACAPCYRFKCPFSMECLDFSVDEVLGAAEEFLAATRLDNNKKVSCV